MLDFATIDRALHACFRAMLGDWDWEAMGKIGIHKAFAWCLGTEKKASLGGGLKFLIFTPTWGTIFPF